VRGQASDATRDARLGSAFEAFRQMGEKARTWVVGSHAASGPAVAP
jgi:hypothetical protein